MNANTYIDYDPEIAAFMSSLWIHDHADTSGAVWSQTVIGQLYAAETLADAYGASPRASNGALIIGAARHHLESECPHEVSAAYEYIHQLADYLASRVERVVPLPGNENIPDLSPPLAAAPLAPIVVGVVGVAAVIATAWYFHSSDVVRSDSVRETKLAQLGALAQLAGTQMSTSGHVDHEILTQLGAAVPSSQDISGMSTGTKIAIGAALGVGGVLLIRSVTK